jgi:hypothetical protein
MEKCFNKGPFSVGEQKIESTWERTKNQARNPVDIPFLRHYCEL